MILNPECLKLFQFRRPAGLDTAVMMVFMSTGLGKDVTWAFGTENNTVLSQIAAHLWVATRFFVSPFAFPFPPYHKEVVGLCCELSRLVHDTYDLRSFQNAAFHSWQFFLLELPCHHCNKTCFPYLCWVSKAQLPCSQLSSSHSYTLLINQLSSHCAVMILFYWYTPCAA